MSVVRPERGSALRRSPALCTLLGSCLASGAGAQGPPVSPPTFGGEIAPILFDHCTPCHQRGGAGPFPLTSFADARRRARQIVEVTESGYMPPWQPAPGFGEFTGERRLDPEDLQLLRLWLEAGTPEGRRDDLPPPPDPGSPWGLGEPDLVLQLPQPIEVPAGGPDRFRNFVLSLPISGRRFVAAVELRPGGPRVVHHATLLQDTSGIARRFDQLDDEEGYAGMEGGVAPGGHFIGWTPGKQPRPFPEGMAWPVAPGTDLVLQLHLLPSGRSELIEPLIGLHFTDQPPDRTPVMLHLGSVTIDIPPGEPAYRIEEELRVPVDVRAFSVYPHAHYLCRSMHAEALLPDSTVRPLIRIEDWDFNWQDEYHYREPVRLPAGTRVRMVYVYDNSSANVRNPFDPPRRITWGPGTRDSMGDLWLKVVPEDRTELTALRTELERIDRERLQAGLEKQLEWRPGDPFAQGRLARLLVSEDREQEALPHLLRALEQRPGAWDLRHDLGIVRARLGEAGRAAVHFREALAIHPHYAATHESLAATLVTLGDLEGAVSHYAVALELRPDRIETLNNLGVALARLGRWDEAEDRYRSVLGLDPDDRTAQRNLAALALRRERFEEAERLYGALVAADPADARALQGLASAALSLGKDGAARRHLERLVTLDPEALDARLQLAVLHLAAGALDAAETELRRILASDPTHADARLGLQEIARRRR